MFKKAAIVAFGWALIGFSNIPAYADSASSNSNLKIGNISLSINNSRTLLTKTEASTGKWLGEQKFKSFDSIMWVPEQNVLFVSGRLENSNISVLVKIKGTGGTGQNMFALNPDGSSMPKYSYRLGSQFLSDNVINMRYNGNLRVEIKRSPKSRVYWIRGTGGTGDNMFALVNNQDCQSMDGYNYLLKCGD
ncbi:hypothetical protein [Nostoc sp.]|uniref:hypothetical protein n=1 Tax=Nostoc sp. TaxID=1180 RepID=UPI002FFB9DC9